MHSRQRLVSFGLRSSLRRIQNGHVKILLISNDLKPRYVVNQIILLTLSKNINVNILCVPKIHDLLKEIVGFACFGLTFENDLPPSMQKFSNWSQKLIENEYPVPEELLTNFIKKSETIPMDLDLGESSIITGNDSVNFDKIYLKAESNEKRTFVPINALNLKPLSFEVQCLAKDKSDFISIDDNAEKIHTTNLPNISKSFNQNKNKQNKYMPTTVWKIMKSKK